MKPRRLGGLGIAIAALAWGTLGDPTAALPRPEFLTIKFKTPTDTLQLARINRLLGTSVHRKLAAGQYELNVPRPQRMLDYSALFLALPGIADVSPYPREEFTLHPQVSVNSSNRTLDRQERVTTDPGASPAASGAPTTTTTTTHREESTTDQNISIPIPIEGGHEVFVTFRRAPDEVPRVVADFNAVFGTKTVEQQGFRTYRLHLPAGLDAERAARIFTLVPDVSQVEPTYGR